jgi:MFS transporter, YNFM family, putative membrane transport protein
MIDLNSKEYRKVSLGLALGSFLVFCNLYLFQPMLPYMAHQFNVSETKINWVFAASTLALALSLVPWAISSESFGRRKILFIGLFSMPVIGCVMTFSDALWALVMWRALMGVAIAAFASVAVAYMVEEFSPEAFSAAIGTYIAANSLGGISGRLIGGNLTSQFGWHTASIVISILTFIGVIGVFLLLPAQQNFSPVRGRFLQHHRSLLGHLSNREIRLAMYVGAFNFALFVNLYSVMGFRLVNAPYSLPIGLASLIFICYLGGTISSKLTKLWLSYYSAISGMICGASISMAGMLIALLESIPAMLTGLILISFGAFFTHTLAYSWVSQKATHAKATATALYLVHYYIGGSLGGFILLYCWQHGAWPMVTAGGMAFYITLYFLCWKLHRQQKQVELIPQLANS